jgi:hypothetical protein
MLAGKQKRPRMDREPGGASNAQPVPEMRFEAETEELLREYRHEVEEVAARAVAGDEAGSVR